MRVLAINFGDETCASSHFRVWQFQRPLRELGIELEGVAARDFSRQARLENYDVVLVQKKLFGAGTVQQIRRRSKRLIYDLDDAIWAAHGRKHHALTRFRTVHRLKAISRAADVCLVANEVLARKLNGWGARTTIIPVVLDESVWTPRSLKEKAAHGVPPDNIRIGWSGGPANLVYLQAIEPALAEVQQAIPGVEFVIHCGKAPQFKSLRYTHVPYRPGEEPAVVRSFDLGLAPLPDNEFATGKSPVKCIQYMASAVVPIVSPIGATRSMLIDGKTGIMARTVSDWRQAIFSLANDSKLRLRLAANARSEFEATYALSRQVPVLAQILRSRG
jgi:glycosyltransferase involved in cell wall biosynthesis